MCSVIGDAVSQGVMTQDCLFEEGAMPCCPMMILGDKLLLKMDEKSF